MVNAIYRTMRIIYTCSSGHQTSRIVWCVCLSPRIYISVTPAISSVHYFLIKLGISHLSHVPFGYLTTHLSCLIAPL